MLSSLTIPRIELPELNRVTLPSGDKVDLTKVNKAAEDFLNNTTEMTVTIGLALVILMLAWMLSMRVASWTQRALVRAKVEETFAAFLGSIARFGVFFTGFVIVLGFFGISLTALIAVLGALSFAVAFALRNTFSHLAAGLMLIVSRPFRVGDYIEIENTEGTVKRITMFVTEINTLSNQRVFIPNSRLWENNLLNHTYNDVRMVEVKIPLSLHTSLKKVREVLGPVLQADARILRRPEPLITTDKVEGAAMVFQVRVWIRTRDYTDVRGELMDIIGGTLHRARMPLVGTPAAAAGTDGKSKK